MVQAAERSFVIWNKHAAAYEEPKIAASFPFAWGTRNDQGQMGRQDDKKERMGELNPQAQELDGSLKKVLNALSAGAAKAIESSLARSVQPKGGRDQEEQDALLKELRKPRTLPVIDRVIRVD